MYKVFNFFVFILLRSHYASLSIDQKQLNVTKNRNYVKCIYKLILINLL